MTARMTIEHLGKRYGEGDIAVHAVRDVHLELRAGEVLLIMGPSGSGKTTLLLMLGGMLRPTEGCIALDGVDLATLKERDLPRFRAEHFGFIFQDFNLLAALSARENVELACNLVRVVGREARERAVDALVSVGLANRLDFLPHQLSGGEQQRVAIARAIVNGPSLILADEPTANLDAERGRDIAVLLQAAARSDNSTVVIVSHDERLREIADRTVWLEDGRLTSVSGESQPP